MASAALVLRGETLLFLAGMRLHSKSPRTTWQIRPWPLTCTPSVAAPIAATAVICPS